MSGLIYQQGIFSYGSLNKGIFLKDVWFHLPSETLLIVFLQVKLKILITLIFGYESIRSDGGFASPFS